MCAMPAGLLATATRASTVAAMVGCRVGQPRALWMQPSTRHSTPLQEQKQHMCHVQQGRVEKAGKFSHTHSTIRFNLHVATCPSSAVLLLLADRTYETLLQHGSLIALSRPT
jgi:hypothetical protein